jgi:SAM-dependent methyltransferase
MSGSDKDGKRIEAAVQRCYSTWGTTYYDEYYGAAAPYPAVHADLIRHLLLEFNARTVLDAGCGPASLMRHLFNDDLDLFGFDLTAEMVDEGKRILRDVGRDPNRIWLGSVLEPGAFRGPPEHRFPDSYDAAICVGVMPHVASEHDTVVFTNLANALRRGGLAIVEARNQLFSLFTMNRPSYEFLYDQLIRAPDLLSRAADQRSEVEAALDDLKTQFRMDLPPVRKGKSDEPGYDEIVSRTHNPLVARKQFEAAGFRDVRILFYHYHAVPPMLAAGFRELFLRASVAMEDPEDWRGHFMASAFLLVGSRA